MGVFVFWDRDHNWSRLGVSGCSAGSNLLVLGARGTVGYCTQLVVVVASSVGNMVVVGKDCLAEGCWNSDSHTERSVAVDAGVHTGAGIPNTRAAAEEVDYLL